MRHALARAVAVAVLTVAAAAPGPAAHAQSERVDSIRSLDDVWGLVWYGDDSLMTVGEIASYCAPILWFSPDEPLLNGTSWSDIRIPQPFPFETPVDTPVVYYRLRRIFFREGARQTGLDVDRDDIGAATVDISAIAGVDLDFFFYYATEEGFGGHDHDVESVEMKVILGGKDRLAEGVYAMAVWKVIGKAHGVLWYDNTLEVDVETRFPLVILVEEGKHASCTDKNGDGYYTPGYDVNRRINDAWGVRDIIRSGGLSTGGFESWMAKVRKDGDAVFPPLPAGSPLRSKHEVDGVYAPRCAKYELRPFPSSALAPDDLKPFIDSKGSPDWPEFVESGSFEQMTDWFVEERFMKSVGIALRYDGDYGISFTFPFFIVKNLEERMSGGWIVNRIYLKDHGLRDFGYNVMYMRSASRWVDGYFAAGFESDAYDIPGAVERKNYFVSETGIKFRFNLSHTPLSFLTILGTEFWGVRIGIKYRGTWEFDSIGYVAEVGAGVW
jgi:hypothetical protein